MIAIKGMDMQTDCKKCPLMATDGVDLLSPMMCLAIWATKHEVKHCVEGIVLDDCPLVEIVKCKDCKHCERRYDGTGRQTIYTCKDDHCNDGTAGREMVVEPNSFCAYGEKTDERTLKYADQDTMMPATQLKDFSRLLGQYMNEQLARDDINRNNVQKPGCFLGVTGVKAQYNHARLIKQKIDVLIEKEIL